MSVYKPTVTEIRNANLHYTTMPSEVLDAVARRYGATTLAVWSFLLNQARGFVIRKQYICKVLQLSERKFQDAMRNLAEMELAYLANGGRDDEGRLHGKAWHVSGLPSRVLIELETWVEEKTDKAKTAQSVAPAPEPAVMPVAEASTDNAENRLSVERTDITIDQENKTIPELPTINEFAQNEFARVYHAYPRKRDRGRALKVWKKITRGMPRDRVTALADQCIENITQRIKTGEWRDLEFVPYAKTWLAGEGWTEQPEGEGSAIRLGLARGETVDEIFDPGCLDFDDGVVIDPDAADFDAWEQKQSA